MKILNGSEIANYVKERQVKQVRSIRQAKGIIPRLAIIQTTDNPVINTYVRLKKAYGEDIGVEVENFSVEQSEALQVIHGLNEREDVHGIIVQLPLTDPSGQREILNAVALEKDVDGLAEGTSFDPATPVAILWLLAGYNVELNGKKIIVVGQGPLVGAPLTHMLTVSGQDVAVADRSTKDLQSALLDADIVITATGSPALVKADYLKHKAVVVDAGVAVESGQTIGDLDESVYAREDITVTPKKGGVGPLTVCALFDNVIKACS